MLKMIDMKSEKVKKTIGIVGRGSHGYQTAKEMSRYFDISFASLPEEMPEMVETFEDLKSMLKVEKGSLSRLLNSEVLICYATHPDVSLILAEVSRSKLLIITGERGKTGSKKQLEEISKARVLMPEICCTVREVAGFEWFFSRYGKPALSLEIENGRIANAKVKRCAFCGATRFVAEKLVGAEIKEAPRLAGLYTQLYPCLATRGLKGGIHLAAEMHRRAVLKGLRL